MYNVETLNFKNYTARQLGQNTILNIVTSSFTLSSDKSESAFLKRRAEEESKRDRPDVSFDSVWLFLTNLIKDLKLSKCENGKNFLTSDLFRSLADMFFLTKGVGGCVRKHYPRALKIRS